MATVTLFVESAKTCSERRFASDLLVGQLKVGLLAKGSPGNRLDPTGAYYRNRSCLPASRAVEQAGLRRNAK